MAPTYLSEEEERVGRPAKSENIAFAAGKL
jgi:hypothetical protein